ncbi:MAG: DNA polymerase I [Ruminococcus sp.]|nr:DNA polymerase I [Ruminococcus sp.]
MKLLAIDGNSIMNRAFYGVKGLTNSKGVPTNALTGFLNTYLKYMGELEPDCVAVAFDLRAPTFRHKASPVYKANRKGMPEELAQQMPLIKKLLGFMGVRIIECEGYEADDILGTLSRVAAESGDECYVLTGDRDSLQLVNDSVTVIYAGVRGDKYYTPDAIMEEYGIEPRQFIEVKALMGDSSDNYKGVDGIGEKTAFALIKECGSVDKLYENLDSIKLTPSVRTKLENGHQDALDSRFLATICLEVPIEASAESCKLGAADAEGAKQLLAELEMFKMIEKLAFGESEAAVEKKVSLAELEPFTSSELNAEVVSQRGGESSCFIYSEGKLSAVYGQDIYTAEDEALILSYFETEGSKSAFEAKAAHKAAMAAGKSLNGLVFACDLAGYLLNSQSSDYSVESLALAYKVTYRKDAGDSADAATLPALVTRLTSQLEADGMMKLFNDIELPLCEVLASMEIYGVRADAEGIREFGKGLEGDIESLQARIYECAGKEFNILSPKQLGSVLFEDLGLKGGKKTKTGYSTNADVLEGLVDKHPIVPMILEYRTLTKLRSTYVEGLLKEIREDGRVHSVFKQTETRTGRISSAEPNMQNIPVRKELGRNMRKFFIAEEGCTLVDADYSQIELRVLASVCGDMNMQEAFKEGNDIHRSTAAQVFGVPEDFVSPEMRSAAKAVNFGIIYGIGAFSLSKDIGVSQKEAKQYIQSYLDNYPKVSEFMDKTVEDCKRQGYVSTIFGRRRMIPEIHAGNGNVRKFGERAAMNAPIQGAAADIIKLAMVAVYRRLKSEKLDAKLILQVHDELIIECREDLAGQVSALLKEEMENAVSLAVPMTADVHSGKSWYIAKG